MSSKFKSILINVAMVVAVVFVIFRVLPKPIKTIVTGTN